MPRAVIQKTSFLGGEAGPLLEGRSDLAQHQLGLRREQNFITLKGGAATRRPGTRYVKNTLNNKPARLIPFIFSYNDASSAFVIELTLATTTSIVVRLIRVSDNTVFTPSPDTITVDATSVNLDEIQYTQSADVLWLVHRSFSPQIVERSSSILNPTPTFTVSNYIASTAVTPWLTLPYMDENVTSLTLAVDNASVGTGRVLTASSPFFNGDSTDVGRYFLVAAGSSTFGACVITAALNTTTATVSVLSAFGGTGASNEWFEGAWSAYRGWPRTICFYNQRIVFGGTVTQPDTFWMSQVANYFKMSNIVSAPVSGTFAISDALNFTLSSQKINEIRWMVGGKKHTIGTSSSEWVGTVTNDGTNLFVQYDEETTHGSAPIQPYRSAYTIPFVQRSGQTIREMVFDFYSDSYTATDLTLFSSHIGTRFRDFEIDEGSESYLIQNAYQESPFNVLWVNDNNGRLFGLTRDKQQNIAAWHSHIVGGAVASQLYFGVSGPDLPAMVTSIISMPDTTTRLDRIWMVVRRTINGADVYHVEFMDDLKPNTEVTGGHTVDNIAAFLDCATLQAGVSSTSWGGYTRFESDNAYVIAQGSSDQIVFNGVLPVDGSGNITLPIAAVKVTCGLHAQAEIRLLPLEGGDAPKINTRSIKRIDLVAIKLVESFGLRVGKDRVMTKTGYVDNTTNFEAIPFDVSSLPLLPTFTGFKEFQVPVSADSDASFALVMQEPWPCTILSVSSRVVTNEI